MKCAKKERKMKSKVRRGLSAKHEDIGPYKAPKSHREPESKRKYSSKANEKIHKVIREFEEGKLHSGSKKGPKVKNLRQAIAIGISEAKRKGYKAGEAWKKSARRKK